MESDLITTKCPACRHEIQIKKSQAGIKAKCPKCKTAFIPDPLQYKRQESSLMFNLIFWPAISLTVVFVLWFMWNRETRLNAEKPVIPHVVGKRTGSATQNNGGLKYEAAHMAKQFVKKKLIAPESAEFPGDVQMVVLGPKRWKFSGKVNSRNNSGAMTLSRYYAVVEYGNNEKWLCSDVKVY